MPAATRESKQWVRSGRVSLGTAVGMEDGSWSGSNSQQIDPG